MVMIGHIAESAEGISVENAGKLDIVNHVIHQVAKETIMLKPEEATEVKDREAAREYNTSTRDYALQCVGCLHAAILELREKDFLAGILHERSKKVEVSSESDREAAVNAAFGDEWVFDSAKVINVGRDAKQMVSSDEVFERGYVKGISYGRASASRDANADREFLTRFAIEVYRYIGAEIPRLPEFIDTFLEQERAK